MAFDIQTSLLAFKCAQGRLRSSLLGGGVVRDTIVVEARQLSHHVKEAVVQEGVHGSSWRLASDEGKSLSGSDLAPFPLGYFNAGLQADLAARIARLADARGIAIGAFGVGFSARYALAGAFADGTGRGFAEAVGGHAAFDCDVADDVLGALVRDAAAQSPALDLVQRPLKNTFALYCNGRRRTLRNLPASSAPAPQDPFLKYSAAPEPVGGADQGQARPVLIAKAPQGPMVGSGGAPSQGRERLSVHGEGVFEPNERQFKTVVANDRPGSTPFSFTTEDTPADRAPGGLALVSAGIAFCYITQLVRFVDARRMNVRDIRLVQTSPFEIEGGGYGRAAPCDTHLFLRGAASEDEFEELQRLAAGTCYLHQTMATATPLRITYGNRGRSIPS